MDLNISNLEICCLAYAKKFDEVKERIISNPECVKQKDRVRSKQLKLLLFDYSILGWTYSTSLGLFKWSYGYCRVFTADLSCSTRHFR